MREEFVHESTLDAQAAEVWSLLRDFRGRELPDGIVERIEHDGDGVGARRTIHWVTGGQVSQQLEELDDGRRVLVYRSIAAKSPQRAGAVTTVTVRERPDGCAVEWRHDHEPMADDRAARAIIRDVFLLASETLSERLRDKR